MDKDKKSKKEFNLRDICHVCRNEDGDRFVGIKADADSVAVYFPLGYQLSPYSEGERELRRDITNLIVVLSDFTEKKDKLLAMKQYFAPQSVDFPVNAYMTVIRDYMTRSYYTETEPSYTTGVSGNVDWSRTIRKRKPIIQPNGSLIFNDLEVRRSSPNDRKLITRVHEFCVYEAFQKLGWLFSSETPRKPQLKLEGNKKAFVGIVLDKLGQTFIDTDKQLFSAMIDMLNYLDEHSPQNLFYFGTDNFEHVWERMIDKVFGVSNKKDYFPRTYWMHLPKSSNTSHENYALEPDTIMIPPNMCKAFVLDAKYYRFGTTGNPRHLPPSSSINKQIVYGEHISTIDGFTAKDAVYNAFIMPYNQTEYDKDENPRGNFLGVTGRFACIGEARSSWKVGGYSYETVQGIVIDTRYLMHHYTINTESQIRALAEKILYSYKYHRSLEGNNAIS